MTQYQPLRDHSGIEIYTSSRRRYQGRPDVCYYVRYRDGGRRVRLKVGWKSQGTLLKDAKKKLGECIAAANVDSSIVNSKITLGDFWKEHYLPKNSDKKSLVTEEILFKKWIAPELGTKRLKSISRLDIVERLKEKMMEAGKSPRTIEYVLAIVRLVFNKAIKWDMVSGKNPAKGVKAPRYDNRKMRFLTQDEADTLLMALKEKSPQLHSMTLVSLQCGLRFGEIAGLAWGDVDFSQSMLTLRDTKNTDTRHAYMTTQVQDVLAGMIPKTVEPSTLVFPSKTGERQQQVSASFMRVVNAIGLNKGIDDPRQKVTFHTARHTFASWLAQQDESLFTIQNLLGHKTATMTARYSHSKPSGLRDAVKRLDGTLRKASNKLLKLVANGTPTS